MKLAGSHGIAALVENYDQPAVVLVWKWPQQDGIDHAENGGVRSDPQSEGEHRHRGKPGALP